MRLQVPTVDSTRNNRSHGFTIAEVCIALAIISVCFTAIVLGYVQASARAEWTGYSLAAESLAIKQIEQARSARWDTAAVPAVCEIYSLKLLNPATNSGVYTGYSWTNLDLPSSGTNILYGTNYVTVKPVTNVTVGSNIMVKVDTVWKFRWRGKTKLYTNSVATYLAPDNKPPEDLF